MWVKMLRNTLFTYSKMVSRQPSCSSSALRRLQLTTNHIAASRTLTYSTVEQGSKYSSNFKQYLTDASGNIKSFMHDVPLKIDESQKTVNMVVEVPRWSNAKFEINTKLEGNPITQDVKKSKVRFIKNLFPFRGYIHNYGALPQTWEDTTNSNGALNLFGDNDPLDVIEIGSQIHDTGSIVEVKVLGSLALIDDGELDWKVVAISTSDQLASELNNIEDVFKHCPGLLDSTREWFRNYKIPDGKPANKFAFNEEYKSQSETIDLIKENHEAWGKLIYNKIEAEKSKLPVIVNTSFENSPGYTSKFDSATLLSGKRLPDTAFPPDINDIYYHRT